MKTGFENSSSPRFYSEIFYITLLGLEAILKRISFKDMILFKEHNPKYLLNNILFSSSVVFNLLSEYGIGKKLEPLLIELFKNQELGFR